jgi:hypothetical protein
MSQQRRQHRRYSRKVHQMRPVSRQNPDGTTSTVLMTSMDNYALPTLFPRDPENVSPDPQDWVELAGSEAFEMARERGELFSFDTQQEADSFAQGSWKRPEEGGDYRTLMDRLRRQAQEK